VASNVVVADLVDSAIGEDTERTTNPGDVLAAVVDQQVDVVRGPDAAMRYDGEPADQEIPRARLVQRAADRDEIRDLWRASVRAIIPLSQASASSKLANR